MKKFQLSNIGNLFKITFKKWYNRDPFNESALIAYNAIFSLPGLLVVVITLAGYFFGAEAVSGKLHDQIAKTMGGQTADQVQQMLVMANRSRDSILASIIGIATILIGATGVFVQLQKSLNSIWEVKASTAKSGIWKLLRTRLFSFGLILSIAFLLLISLVLSSLLAGLGSWVEQHWSESLLVLFQILNFIFSLVIITVLFALMFKMLPDAKIKWRSVWIGAFVTSLLFVIGKSVLGLYFGKADPGSGYGAAGSIILILLWTSYSSMIVFFGAEFTKVYADYHYEIVPPSDTAVKNKMVLNT
jgi:membrane protein